MTRIRVDETEYEKDRYSEPKDEVFQYTRKNPINEESRDNHNTLFLKRTLWSEDVDVREMLGYLIAKQCGIPSCEVAMAIYPTIRDKYENAVISYAHTSKYDRTYLPISLVQDHRRKLLIPKNDNDYMLDVEGILNAIFAKMQEKGRPIEEYNEFVQSFIDMMVYDIAFVNSDRDNKNWYIREDTRTGKIDLYPLFDNASVFASEDPYEEMIDEYTAYSLSEFHPLLILTPTDFSLGLVQTDYHDMLEYLLRRYPKQTEKALAKVSNVNPEFIERCLDIIPDVNPIRRDQMLKVFEHRKRGINHIVEKHKKLQKLRGE